jgi:hypothetical protein
VLRVGWTVGFGEELNEREMRGLDEDDGFLGNVARVVWLRQDEGESTRGLGRR